MDFLYPNADTRVYIPLDFGAQRGRVVFEAVHRDADAVLHWHLDQQYLGHTQLFHQVEFNVVPGMHVVTIVDQHGASKTRQFEVLGVERSALAQQPTAVAF
jgi:penicillin-binding protein 1C